MRGINTYQREIWKRVFVTIYLVCDGKLTNHKLLIMLNQEWYSIIIIIMLYLINSWNSVRQCDANFVYFHLHAHRDKHAKSRVI